MSQCKHSEVARCDDCEDRRYRDQLKRERDALREELTHFVKAFDAGTLYLWQPDDLNRARELIK